MIIGENYLKNIVGEVLPAIGKEIAVLQSELLKINDITAGEIYREFIERTQNVIDNFLLLKIEEMRQIRKDL